MRKKSKIFKVLGCVLAASMLFTACGNSESQESQNVISSNTESKPVVESQETNQEKEREPISLTWYVTVDGIKAGEEAVKKAVNEYVKEKLNVDLEIHFVPKAEYSQTVGTKVSAGTEVDILFTATNYVPFSTYAEMGAFLPLNDYLDEYLPVTKADLPEEVWGSVTVDGNIYAVPHMKDLASRYGFVANQTMLDDLGVQFPEGFDTAEDLIDFLYEAKEARDKKYPEKKNDPLIDNPLNNIASWYYAEGLQGSNVYANVPGLTGYEGYGEGEIAFCPYYTQEYRDAMQAVRDMVKAGIAAFDYKEFDSDNVLRNSGELLGWLANGYVYMAEDSYEPYFKVKHYPASNAITTNSYVRSACTAITATCEYPERALEVVELINTDTYLATVLRFGTEGDCWTDDDGDGIFTPGPLNSDITNRYWWSWYGMQIGSIKYSKVPEGNPTNFMELIRRVE